ncbi:MAG: hypothetical protein K6B68_05490 [Eubacterium sp.]|nr:hypothetical protein [Eubacterium sp.]
MKAREFFKKAIFSLLVLLTVTMIAEYNDVYAASQVEIEENGTHLTLNEGSRHTFVSKSGEEEKWYIFNIDKRGCFRIKFNTTENTDGDKVRSGWWWGLYRKGNLNSTVREWSRVSDGTSSYYFFEPGTYYLRVTPASYSGAWDCEYEVAVLFDEDNAAEIEINDSGKDANVINENVKYSGALDRDEDEDWFKLHLDKADAVKIKMSVDERTDGDELGNGWSLLIYDSSLNNLIKEYNNIKTDFETPEIPFGKGDCYIRIKNSSTYYDAVNCIYNLSFSLSGGQWESEDNSESNKATSLTADDKKVTMGTLYNKNDVDWYKVKITKNGYFNIRMYLEDEEHQADLGDGFKLEMYYKDMTYIGSFTFMSKQATQELPFKKGIYYIKVSAQNTSNSPINYKYGIDVVQKSSNKWERENNDDIKNATKMSAKIKMYRGFAHVNEDVDYYMFEVKKKAKYTISLAKYDTQQIFEYGWNFELLDKDNERIDYKEKVVKSDSFKVTLEPGKYYIRIGANYNSGWFGHNADVIGKVYKLTVKNK